ncbi:MAG: preprotein translocase subunit SecG [Betaproteobacteria bacterium]|jgi:preprotein translocase subunit SecG|nr:preprotein translocase subunit SecG [Betaproteobacteria bacterium]
MGWLMNLVLTLQVLSAIGVIVLVLLQQGKGADMGAAFGSGTSGSLFGATGSSNFLSRTTAILATVFFIATLALSYLATQARQPSGAGSVMQNTSEVPVAPPASPAPAGTPAASQVPGAPADSGAKK